jgi:tyrosyl-tRNA synthetase
MVHGKEELDAALSATAILFGQGTTEQLSEINEKLFLQIFEGVDQFKISRSELKAGINILDLLAVNANVFASKGEARKMVQQNALSINKEKYTDPNGVISDSSLINNRYLLVQKGKKKYSLLIAE